MNIGALWGGGGGERRGPHHGVGAAQPGTHANDDADESPFTFDVRGLVVAPGFVETEMTEVLPEEKKAEYKAQIPLGRYATTDEVAATVTWLASEGAAYVTGAVIPVDGGLGMGH